MGGAIAFFFVAAAAGCCCCLLFNGKIESLGPYVVQHSMIIDNHSIM